MPRSPRSGAVASIGGMVLTQPRLSRNATANAVKAVEIALSLSLISALLRHDPTAPKEPAA